MTSFLFPQRYGSLLGTFFAAWKLSTLVDSLIVHFQLQPCFLACFAAGLIVESASHLIVAVSRYPGLKKAGLSSVFLQGFANMPLWNRICRGQVCRRSILLS
ncbi:hypothetical protein F5B22DRAFT_585811 [Xylaria bambusicola]|uniref:uncharacterized protein n=1 Tax=Xylaria bambusicola TaxID=326684 RepID=UPI002007227C|nr:uncharacterized protein F5B22DRAFT_585811 [Xylaria bambusicola]KAI0526449.1 hypothetical protein F5B22DRAFT_585811 [Xylaria bambusicola]